MVPDRPIEKEPLFQDLTPDAYRELLLELQEMRVVTETQQAELLLVRELKGLPNYFDSLVEDDLKRKRAEELAKCQSDVLELISQGLPAENSMTMLISRIEELCPGMLCTILRVEDDGLHLRHYAAVGMPDQYNRMIDGIPIGPRAGSCGTAAYVRKQVIVEDIAYDPLWEHYRNYALQFDQRACWSTPILDEEGDLLGTFANYYSFPCKPTDDHLRVMKMATYLASIAMSKQRKEESLRINELALHAISQGVVITAQDEKILWANPAFGRMTGFKESEFLGKKCTFIQGPNTDPQTIDSIRTAIRDEKEFSGEVLNYRKDKTPFWNELTITPVRDAQNQVTRFICVLRDISERKKTDAALRDSEARYRAIVEQAPLGIAEGDFAGNRFISVNQRYADIVGYSIADLMDMSFVDFTHPDDLSLDMREMQKLAAGEIPYFAIEKRYLRKDGEIVWVRLTVAALGLAGDLPAKCLAVIDDITRQKNAESALVHSESRYRAIVAGEPECVKLVSAKGELLEMNPAGLAMLEAKSIKEVQAAGIISFIQPEYRAAFLRLHSEAIGGNRGLLEFEIVGLKGRHLWLETHAAPLPNADGSISQMLGITRDITQSKRSVVALQQSEARLHFLLNNTPTMIYTRRASGDFGATYVTDNVQQQLGHKPRDFLDQATYWSDNIHPDDAKRVLNHLNQLDGKEGHTLEYRFRHADGGYRRLHDECRLLRDTLGNPTEIIGSLLDITSLKQAEASVHRLNAGLEKRVLERTSQLETANKELESFSYSVSHDLRAPLRGIDGYARMLQEDFGDKLGSEGCRMIEVVRGETKRMGRLIDDLLAFSRMGRKHLENIEVDMRHLAETAFEMALSGIPQAAVQFHLSSLPSSLGDPALLQQVFVNLISNALKFTRRQTAPIVEVGFEIDSDCVRYFVKDNGVGFDERYSSRLFGVFQRLHSDEEFEGTGIGLALVQRIVQRHGGRVWATSKPNGGATFYFTMPTKERSSN